jgi:hypothetical protein
MRNSQEQQIVSLHINNNNSSSSSGSKDNNNNEIVIRSIGMLPSMPQCLHDKPTLLGLNSVKQK